MNSRERCLRAIEIEETDLIPINIWIDAPEPLNSLMKHLGICEADELLQHLQIDFRGFLPNLSSLGIGLKGGYEEKTFKDESGRILHRNMFGVVSAFSSDGLTNMYVDHPLRNVDVFNYNWPEVREEDFDRILCERRKYEDYCLIGGTLQAFETACSLFGYNEIFRSMLTKEKTVNYVLDKLFSITYEQAKLLVEAGVDQVYNGDDVGTQTTMMISPKLWRNYLKPRYERLAGIIHHGDSYFHFHSDGSIERILPDLIEIGVDVLEPLQPEAMDVVKIKENYGDKITLEGAISIQKTLPFGNFEDIESEVKFLMKNLGPTGYIMRPSHTILWGTPIQNILTLYASAEKFRSVL